MSTAKYVAAVRSVSKRFMLVLALLAIVVGGFAAGAAAAGVQKPADVGIDSLAVDAGNIYGLGSNDHVYSYDKTTGVWTDVYEQSTQPATCPAGQTGTPPNCVTPPTTSTITSGIAVSGLEFAESTLPGVAGTNYNVNSQQRYTDLSAKGFKSVRLPFLSGRLFPTAGGAVDATYAGYIQQNIAWAKNAGMDVWLDAHDYARYKGNQVGSTGYTQAEFVRQKVAIVNQFKANTNLKGFEIDNEPHDLSIGRTGWYGATSQAFWAIQDTGWTGTIGIPTYGWSSNDNFFVEHGTNFTAPIKNDRAVYVFHNYFNAGNTGYNHPAVPDETAQIHVDRIAAVIDWAKAQGVKIAVTEFGMPGTQAWIDNAKPFVAKLKAESATVVWSSYWASGDWYASETKFVDLHLQLWQ